MKKEYKELFDSVTPNKELENKVIRSAEKKKRVLFSTKKNYCCCCGVCNCCCRRLWSLQGFIRPCYGPRKLFFLPVSKRFFNSSICSGFGR